MNVRPGRRLVPRRKIHVSRTRGGAKRLRETDERKYRRNTVKMLVSLAVFMLLLAVKFLFPAGAEAVSKYISGGLDYRAAFSALGKAITSGENILEVFKGISLGGFQKAPEKGDGLGPEAAQNTDPKSGPGTGQVTGTGEEQGTGAGNVQNTGEDNGQGTYIDGLEAVEAMNPVTILDEFDLSGEADTSGYAGSDNGDMTETTEDDVYLEELLLRLPASELEDQSGMPDNELPENVSYDYYVIEFDYVTPLKGNMTSAFGYRKHPITGKKSFHYGIDIGGRKGATVSAFSSGTAELTGYNSIYGNYLFIRHKDGIITFYGHLSKILVDEGQLVRTGDPVALVGSTGLSTGPHLHFEIRNGDVILDPLHYVSPEG
jgi:hypothetical protein